MHTHTHVYIPLPPPPHTHTHTISKGGSFPFRTTQRSVPCEMDSGSAPVTRLLGTLVLLAAKWIACLSSLAGTMWVPHVRLQPPRKRNAPQGFCWEVRVQRITLGAVFSGRAVLLLVCAIVSMLGVLCPFSRATGSLISGPGSVAPPAAHSWLLSLGHLAGARPSSCGERHPLETQLFKREAPNWNWAWPTEAEL